MQDAIWIHLLNDCCLVFHSDHLCLWSLTGVCVHLPVWPSKAGHIQGVQAGLRQGIQTETHNGLNPRAVQDQLFPLEDKLHVTRP